MKKFFTLSFLMAFCLSAAAQWDGAGWYRVHNSGGASTTGKRFISVVGNQYKQSTDIDAFKGCIRMVAPGDEISDPGTVIYINAKSSARLSTQGVNTYDLTGLSLTISDGGDVDGKPTYIPNYSYLGFITMYLQVYKNALDVGQNNTYAKYWLEPLTEANCDTYYFGVKPTKETIKDSEGYYWTTLYAGFSFKIPETGGVEGAYVIEELTDESDGKTYARPVKKWGKGDTVPRATPVLLQLSSADAADNVLIPTGTPTAATYTGSNLLSGTYFDLHETGSDGSLSWDYNISTPNNQDNYRVLNVSPSTGTIGFFKTSRETMAANKAWLDLSKSSNANVGTVFVDFDNIVDETTGISEVNLQRPANDMVYDLQGRRVENPNHGIYIVNGKKVVFK